MSVIDPYLIPGTNVQRNLVNAQSEQALSAAENDWVTFRFLQLRAMPLTAEGTVEQLQRIHHFLFQDVYEWAGQIRTIDMSKGGGSVFQPLELFATGAQYAESTLRSGASRIRGDDPMSDAFSAVEIKYSSRPRG